MPNLIYGKYFADWFGLMLLFSIVDEHFMPPKVTLAWLISLCKFQVYMRAAREGFLCACTMYIQCPTPMEVLWAVRRKKNHRNQIFASPNHQKWFWSIEREKKWYDITFIMNIRFRISINLYLWNGRLFFFFFSMIQRQWYFETTVFRNVVTAFRYDSTKRIFCVFFGEISYLKWLKSQLLVVVRRKPRRLLVDYSSKLHHPTQSFFSLFSALCKRWCVDRAQWINTLLYVRFFYFILVYFQMRIVRKSLVSVIVLMFYKVINRFFISYIFPDALQPSQWIDSIWTKTPLSHYTTT